MNKTTWSAGDRVYVPGLSVHCFLVDREDRHGETWAVVEDSPKERLHKVHVSAMEAPKQDGYREPGTQGEW